MRLLIRDARVLDPARGVDLTGDLAVADGRVVSAGAVPEGFEADRVLEARGLVACPGLIDLAARMREPGAERKATVASETRAAASGGITTVTMPPDTRPVVDTPAVVELIHQRAGESGLARVELVGALTRGLEGEQIATMGALAHAGCIGVSNARHPVRDTEVMRRAMEYATTFGLTVHLQPEDPWLADGGCVHEGAVSSRLGLPGIPDTAETIALARDLLLAERVGATVHVGRLSSGRSVDLVAEARERGVRVSADVAAHQLLLTDEDVAGFDGTYHVRPPLRGEPDRARLVDAVAGGTITAVCSDHQPHDPDAKLRPFPETEPGISGLETLLALVLRLVDDGRLTLDAALAALTSGPAAVLGLERGTLAPGAVADVCVFDPAVEWQLEARAMTSRGHNSPFLHQTMKGRVAWAVLGGNIVFEGERAR